MPTKYGGMSSFFDSPAGKALATVGRGGDAGGDVGLGPAGGLFATMRPGLRNALADSFGEEQLRQLDRRKPTRIDYADGPADGGLGQRPEFYIPETMDPIANMETARQQARSNFMQDDELEGIRDTGARRREAEGEDYASSLAAKRYWDPMTYGMREDDMARKMRLATEPARIAADSRENVAATTGGSKVAAAGATANGRTQQSFINSLDDMVQKGVFGFEKGPDGKVQGKQPSPEAQKFFSQFLTQAGGGAGGGGGLDPAVEAEVQSWEQKGYSRDEILQHFKQIGKIK
jgi:hypothetical protein